MSTTPGSDQLRANLRAAGIQPSEADIQGIAEKGFLSRIGDFEQLIAGLANDTIPDYLDHAQLSPGAVQPGQPRAQPFGAGSPIGAIAAQIRTRQVSPAELTEQALAHIAARDPQLNAFQLVLAEQARAAARLAEREIATGTYRGPLHGVPIAVKDLLAMAGTRTTAGSRIFADRVTSFDAAAVERLVAAGAVIVGKTRLSRIMPTTAPPTTPIIWPTTPAARAAARRRRWPPRWCSPRLAPTPAAPSASLHRCAASSG
jgi:aspartyl-tRNA(Asn)/glutamyl-tRNA(Gln) amidotransferase subunit A